MNPFKIVIFVLIALAGSAYGACIAPSTASSLTGTPFSGCSISGSTVTCTQDIVVNTQNLSVCTTAAPLTVNFGTKKFEWKSNSGTLGSLANRININASEIKISGNSFSSFGNWTASNIICETNTTKGIVGTLTAPSNTCSGYVVTPPTVVTNAATSITSAGATLNGTVTSPVDPPTVWFEYGTTTSYGTTTAQQLLTAGTNVSASSTLSGLTCGVTYNFRIVASDAAGTTTGSNQTFVPTPCIGVPTLVTNTATSVTGTSATLNGTVSSNGASTSVSFDYGLTTSYGSSVVASQSPLSSSASNASVTGSLTGLTCGQTYNYRVKATNSSGTTLGGNQSFSTASCGGTFDAYENSYSASNAIANSAKLKTHVASNTGICVKAGSCSITIGSFNLAKTALNTSFTGPVLVEIVDSSSGTCSGYPSIATVSSSLTLGGSGETQVTLPAVPNAYPNARIRISFPATGTPTSQSCSSDNFAIRPSSFTSVAATDGSISTAGNTNTLSTTSFTSPPTGATPIHKSGRPFSLSATASNVEGTKTTNYAGTPQILLTQCTGTACISTLGTVQIAGAFSAGALTSPNSNATYNSIGSFNLALQDTTFAAVDALDSSNSELAITSTPIPVGRFVPDHFDTTIASQGCGAFTYSGQPLSVTVTAKDSSGNTLSQYASSGLANSVAISEANGVQGAFSTETFTFSSGAATVSRSYTFTNRSTIPSNIKVRATDTDGISSATGNDGTSGSATEASFQIVSGRLRIQNAYGSDQLPLPLPMQLQYFDSTGWKKMDGTFTDTCTSLTAANFAFTTTGPACNTPVSTCGSALSVSGTGSGPYKTPWTVTLSKPGSAVNACVTLNLDGTASGKQCVAAGATTLNSTSASSPWLKFPWGGGAAANPNALATFGLFKGKYVDLRENY